MEKKSAIHKIIEKSVHPFTIDDRHIKIGNFHEKLDI